MMLAALQHSAYNSIFGAFALKHAPRAVMMVIVPAVIVGGGGGGVGGVGA